MRNNDSDRLQGFFTPHRRFSNKLPSLYLDSRHDPDNPYQLEVYFVNNSGFVLEWIELPSPLLYEYKNNLELSKQYHAIEPNEAVLLAQFDVVVDSDFLHQLIIVWKAHNQSLKEVRMIGKGITKFRYKVLEWLPDGL